MRSIVVYTLLRSNNSILVKSKEKKNKKVMYEYQTWKRDNKEKTPSGRLYRNKSELVVTQYQKG